MVCMAYWEGLAKDLESYVGRIVRIGSSEGVLKDAGAKDGWVTLEMDKVSYSADGEKHRRYLRKIDLRRVNSIVTPAGNDE